MGVFDAARWHVEAPPERAGTHIAIYVAWLVTRDLISADHTGDPSAAWYIDRIRRRERTARDFLTDLLDERLADADLSPEGLEFTTVYYERYFADYARVFGADRPSLYDVPDSWDSVDRLTGLLDHRLDQFRRWRARHGASAEEPTGGDYTEVTAAPPPPPPAAAPR